MGLYKSPGFSSFLLPSQINKYITIVIYLLYTIKFSIYARKHINILKK